MRKCTNNRVCKIGVSDFSWRDICAKMVLNGTSIIVRSQYETEVPLRSKAYNVAYHLTLTFSTARLCDYDMQQKETLSFHSSSSRNNDNA